MKKHLFRRILNFRDLGGHETADGRRIKPNLFYRSGGLYRLNEKELNRLAGMNIRTVLDLRTAAECKASPDPVIPGARMLQTSGLIVGQEDIDFSPKGMRQLGDAGYNQLKVLTGYYQRLPFDNEAFRVLFKVVKDDELPIIFHCASGKDRTGVAAMLLMLLFGVPEEIIMQDYLWSNEFFRVMLEKEFVANSHLLEEHPEYRELLQMMNGVSENIGKAVLKIIKEKHPSVEEYFLEEYGYRKEDIEEIRSRYLY